MSIFRLTDVQDNTRSSKQYWDKRCDEKWGDAFHGHYCDRFECLDRMDNRNYSVLSKLISNVVKEKKTVNILECACGNGRYVDMLNNLKEMYEFTFNYTGIDFADKNIEEAKKLYKSNSVDFYMSDMLQYKTDKKFDIIFMTAAVSSIEQNSYEIMEHLKTMLMPKGVIVIFEQHLYCVIDNIGLDNYGK